jgi:hypothetical protein
MPQEGEKSLAEWSKEQLLRAERWMGRQVLADPFLRGDRIMVFVLGHMRTGSSLLVHILGSNPDIVGFGETHSVYTRPEDFGAAHAQVCRRLRRFPGTTRYVLDKVLHKYQMPRAEVVVHPSTRLIFMMRRPDRALSSIVQNIDFIDDAEAAYEHYVSQLQWMADMARRTDPERWTYLRYADLVDETAAVFDRLEQFLGLEDPLTEHYQTTRFTGVERIGDPGKHIGAGRIKRSIDRTIAPQVRPFLQGAQAQFDSCCQALQSRNVWGRHAVESQ